VYSDGPQAVIWAIGPLNERQEVSYHGSRANRDPLFIDFARAPKWNCPSPAGNPTVNHRPTDAISDLTSTVAPSTLITSSTLSSLHTADHDSPALPLKAAKAWRIPPLLCPSERVFRAQIGPAGGPHGYSAITGRVGWGIAWYVNGLLVPEITVQRGVTYTFLVEGGDDGQHSSRRHPLYITDSPEGGYAHKTPEERRTEQIFAGVQWNRSRQEVEPQAGRLCVWQLNTSLPDGFEQSVDFEQFRKTLNLHCEPGKPAAFTWTPDHNTPDELFYQCFSHR
jgi:hypothetical protein